MNGPEEYPAAFWNERYSKEEYIYGKAPNSFFKKELKKLKPGKILLPAEGEGRNAVYASSQGWDVMAFDMSSKGKEKALRLANEYEVTINYKVSNVLEFETDTRYDAIGLCYAHFPASIRAQAHQHLLQFLKPGGMVIFEAFAKAQLGKNSGGPKNETMLFSLQEIKEEFPLMDFIFLEENTIELAEGKHHQGTAEVIQFLAHKKI